MLPPEAESELSTEADYVAHFQGKVSLNMLVIRWLRGENRHMNTNSYWDGHDAGKRDFDKCLTNEDVDNLAVMAVNNLAPSNYRRGYLDGLAANA